MAEEEVKKGQKPVARPLVERRGKKYQAVAKLVDKTKTYDLKNALDLVIKTATTKFDSTVEIHVRLNVDPRQADQNIRSTVSLPNGTGKTVKVAVFAPDDQAKLAKAAGADFAGDEELLQMLNKENLDFDVLISTPAYMPKLGKYARLLGPKGLMPNPKAGTVTADIKKAVTEAKAGKIEYRVDKQSIIHTVVGKVSFGTDKLLENAESFMNSLKNQKPASIKSVFIKSVSISTTMGPSVKVENVYN
ncbi:MAG: 50S ribosomal protein L1 [Candidatus Nomurabacteria bacterium]|nr:50S ribosomal protein L1 [Candidatus Nomurabacteria bacterium]